MYKIKSFKVGDKIYKHINSNWELCGEIVKVTDECYGMRIKSIIGIIMTNKDLFESLGYIGICVAEREAWPAAGVGEKEWWLRGKKLTEENWKKEIK